MSPRRRGGRSAMSRRAARPKSKSPPQRPAQTGNLFERCVAWRPAVSLESLAFGSGLYFAIVSNQAFWKALSEIGAFDGRAGYLIAIALFVAVASFHAILLCLVLFRSTAKPVLLLVFLLAATINDFSSRYTVYIDVDMVRTVLSTDTKEASELLTMDVVLSIVGQMLLPTLVLWRVRIKQYTWKLALARRVLAVFAATVAVTTAITFPGKQLASLVRNHKSIRYLVTPANAVVAAARVAFDCDTVDDDQPRDVIAPDARLTGHTPATRPHTLIIVVGETVRAQNWGLSGYQRQTTPRLSELGVVNFSSVAACGSSTEVSLPCMFSAVGRRDYDRSRIRRTESLLHVLERAGIRTLWRDNQTGCKGVCEGLAFESFRHADDARCDGATCSDTIMLDGLDEAIARTPGDIAIVLHQLGNHGPSYYRRYPPSLAAYQPACESPDLGECSRQEIVNAYDNAILATDDFVAEAIELLAADPSRDAALIYLSDHGESLGEGSLYLHGVPYLIAPDTQLQVPMVVWVSPGMREHQQLDLACLTQRAAEPTSHDHLFHSVLGLMEVNTQAYDPTLDVFNGCRGTTSTTPR